MQKTAAQQAYLKWRNKVAQLNLLTRAANRLAEVTPPKQPAEAPQMRPAWRMLTPPAPKSPPPPPPTSEMPWAGQNAPDPYPTTQATPKNYYNKAQARITTRQPLLARNQATARNLRNYMEKSPELYMPVRSEKFMNAFHNLHNTNQQAKQLRREQRHDLSVMEQNIPGTY